jgi:hypothetical protein
MSLKDLAEHIKAEGRYGDTELVHMTKGEVAGLQQLAESAGGSLTINPKTGQPEAFFLAALLPTILGAAAPALGAAATGAGLTGLGGLLSGKFGAMGLGALAGGLMNRQNPLLGAITGGLGGMGGAGLAKGLTGVGAGAAQNAAISGLTGPGHVANTMAAGVDPMLANAIRPELMSQAAQGATGATNLAAANATNQFMTQPLTTQLGQGAKALMQPGGPSQLVQSLGGVGGALKTGSMAAAPMMGGLMSQRPMEMPEERGSIPEYDFAYNPTGYTTTGSEELRQFRPTFTRRAAAGGVMDLAEGGIADLAKGGMKAGGFVIPADVVSMVGEGNTEAGYKDIARAIPGATPIRGKDGGQADTVKTSIEGKQPARVAHGEMYVPPEAVKRAGGAKKLYAMMDKVRKQAKGDTKQIKPVDIRKALA